MSRTMIGLAVAGLIIGAAFGTLALRTRTAEGPSQGQTQVTGKALVGGPFSLIDQTGKHVTDKDFRGKYMLVFFGYTNCPDICPAGLQVMSAALEKLGDRGKDIVPIFITVDPERDTQEKLAAYVKNFTPRLVGLTGSPSDIAATAKAYRVFYQKVPDQSDPKNYSVDHSSIFYLMGKDGNLVAPIPYSTDVAQLTQAIDKALQ
ncbi:SCO family protein [Hyphomicrobium sp.]|jgi:protein SCO1/2|uniref:SCO family protein n=1 Tax=Hyphomicrobium sp. TaxID=82 RepID=UPI002C94F7E3|nr:SCO family protein [Hyphomicrobium sp.]HVZ05874.1 SCO family protein [Hyphomicrobium sp.]